MSALESASREELLTLIAVLQEQNTQAKAQVAALEEQNAALAAEVDRLNGRVAELERRLSRNSGNSSLPPSSDRFERPTKPAKPASGRKRGRQPGAPGSSLRLVENPDEIVDHRPKACGGCARRLATKAPSLGFVRRQVVDIPPTSATVTEHRLHTVRCRCGVTTTAALPENVADAAACYGPNLRALAVYLLVFQHVPVERTALLIKDLTGAEVSTGWVVSMLAKAAELAEDSVNLIKALLILGHLLHADETTTKVGGVRRWLHVAATEKLTFLGLASRSKAGADSLGVLPAFRGTLVHDSLSLYNGYTDVDHQLCGAHLIRELTAAEQDHLGQLWPAQIRWALSELNKQAITARQMGWATIPPERSTLYLKSFHQGVAVGLSLHPRVPGRKQSPARNLLERLRDRSADVLRFCDDPLHGVFTNNCAERAVRPAKTQLKISGTHQSEAGAAHWLKVRSYLDSARKHGLGAFEAIRRAFIGELWMPPIALT
jgi:transposase